MPLLAVDDVVPFEDWAAAGRTALAVLHRAIGLDVWMLTHVEDGQQIVLHAHPPAVVPIGTAVPWDRSFCRKMSTGEAPRVATVAAAVPAYRDLMTGQAERVAAYVGVPLVTRERTVFGTLCGTSSRAQPRSLARYLPLVELTARMLSSLLPPEAAPWPAGPAPGRVAAMTTPTDDDLPEPRDIVLEQATPEQVADLEAQSPPEDEQPPRR